MRLEKIFYKGLELHHYANTAYPLKPTSFREYRVKENDKIENLLNESWKKVKEMTLYVHIPFCEKRCKFCEYVVVSNDDKLKENEYVDLLLKEIDFYGNIIDKKNIVGYDMGGGTPLYLLENNLERITNKMFKRFDFDSNKGLSIETTPVIAANNYEKLKSVHDLGYKRISMGIQTINKKLLDSFERKGSIKIDKTATENIKKAGYKRLNIDIMYGFLHQSEVNFKSTVLFAIDLQPEYISLYRNRYKGTKLEYQAKDVELSKVNLQYSIAYNLLNDNGFVANIGKNTFSRIKNDYGTSEYLTKRVIEGTAYLGLGLGAQSYGHNYLSYNEGAEVIVVSGFTP